jgi:hypothetical protein
MRSRPNLQLNGNRLSRPKGRKRNKWVRLRGRLAGSSAPRADPTPPSRMHYQRDLGMRGTSWVLGCWSSGVHAGSAGGLLALAHLGRTWLPEHTERPGSRRRPKKVIGLVTDEKMLSELFSDPRRRTGRVLAGNPPAESAGPRLGAGFPAAARVARGRSQHEVSF